jgi:hypothetical protein
MKEITAFKCETCGRIFEFKAEQHEEICKWEKEGHDVWVEHGKVKHCPHIPTELFGQHDYGDYEGTSNCKNGCGCWAGPSSSGGPVDPFGACPHNPINNNKDTDIHSEIARGAHGEAE